MGYSYDPIFQQKIIHQCYPSLDLLYEMGGNPYRFFILYMGAFNDKISHLNGFINKKKIIENDLIQ